MGSLSWQADEDLPADMEQARLYRQARQRVHVRFGFYYHFAIYVIVVSGLFVLDILNGTDHFFVQWVAGGWGIGIVAHFLKAFTLDGILGTEAIRRSTERELRRLENRSRRLE